MKALILIQKLKQSLLGIGESGGSRIFFVEPNYDLVQQLKIYAFKQLQETENNSNLKSLQYFADDLLSRDIFKARIRYCIVKLNEFAVEEKDHFGFISRAIDLLIKKNSYWVPLDDSSTIKDALVGELAKCFQPWYRPEDLFLIDFAQERQLIFTNPEEKNWMVSNLGNYFTKLSPFEAIAFLCALEVILTLELHENAFISAKSLEKLILSWEQKSHPNWKYARPYSLRLFGIIKGFYSSGRNLTVTDFGYRILSYVQKNLEDYQELIMLLLEAEATGFKYSAEISQNEILTVIEKSTILIDAQKKSIKKALDFYMSESYLDGLRLVYPILEGTLDTALRNIGLKPSSFRGMRSKIERLEKEKLISTKMSTGLEIFSSRNKIVHGNILEEDNEAMRPLFLLVLAYLKRLVTELDGSANS